MEQIFVKDRLRLLLDHFGDVGDPREAAKVKFPLPEVLFLVTCVSHEIDWLTGGRRYPDEPRFHALNSLVCTTTRTEWRGKVSEETRYFISSARLIPNLGDRNRSPRPSSGGRDSPNPLPPAPQGARPTMAR